MKFTTQNGFLLVKPEDIIYCEADGNYTFIYLIDGNKELVTLQLGALENKLPTQLFLRINRSTTINLNFAEAINRKTRTIFLTDYFTKTSV